MCRLIKFYLVIQLVLILCARSAVATTVNASVAISASVAAACSVSATPIAFGAYTQSGSAITGTSTITVTCTSTTPYSIGLDAGSNTPFGSTIAARKMISGSNILNYGLYRDSSMTLNWGNTVTTDTVHGTGNGTAQTVTIYGKIPAGQNVAPGSYSDTVTLTVTF